MSSDGESESVGLLKSPGMPVDAVVLLKRALKEAETSNKRVFVYFSQPTCAPCKVLASFLEQNSSLFEDDYQILKIDTIEMTNGDAVQQRIALEHSYPYIAILDASGDILVNSVGRNGNVGFPVSKYECDHFVSMIRDTLRHSSEGRASEISAVLEQFVKPRRQAFESQNQKTEEELSKEIHNDAAAIAAIAVERFYARTREWPQNWRDLDSEIERVIKEVTLKYNEPKPRVFDDPFANPESQSIFSRAPDLHALSAVKLRDLVDIDFDFKVDPAELAEMSWWEFSGIAPHEPSFNMHLFEIEKLFARLNEATGSLEASTDSGK
tara:strand:- start:9357 stop:10328 length:972 start_codon:yes stop_codon:yes gene_type:complete